MTAPRAQIAIPAVEEHEQPAETVEAHEVLAWWERMRVVLLGVVREEGGFDVVAGKLDKIFARIGHPVSASVLRASLNDGERNYFRGEWYPWFSRRSAQVRTLLGELDDDGGEATPDELAPAAQAELEQHGKLGREIWAAIKVRALRDRRRRGRRGRPPP